MKINTHSLGTHLLAGLVRCIAVSWGVGGVIAMGMMTIIALSSG